jgi:hypothetical protein
MTYRVPSVHSHYLVFGKSPLINTGGPMRANFLIAGDAVIFAAKRAGTVTYLWGITVENLIAWAPPKKAGELVPEEGIMQSWKSTHSDIKELVALADTETHPLTALADKLMSHLPTFAAAKIKDGKGAAKWCVNTFTYNIKFVVDASEVEERKRAKDTSPRPPGTRRRLSRRLVARQRRRTLPLDLIRVRVVRVTAGEDD